MKEIIRDIISRQLQINSESIFSDDDIVEKFGADSLDFVELLTGIEDNFGIAVPDDAAVDMKTPRDM